MLEGGLEYRMAWGRTVEAAIFADFGRIWTEPGSGKVSRLEISPGVGIRYLSPAGPIRVDLGYRFRGIEPLQVVTTQIRPFVAGDDPADKISGMVGDQVEVIDYVATEELAVLDPRVLYGPQSGFSFSRFQLHLSIGQAVLVSKMGRRRAKKALKIAAGALITLALGAIAGVLILTSTRPGQAFVGWSKALRRIEGNLNGEITISGLRSAGLDRGVRLLGLRLVAPDGSLVLAVDSAEAEYSIREILSGDVALSGVTLWRPTLTVMKEAPDRPFNLVAFLGAGESPVPELGHEREPAEAATRFLLEDVEIQDGTIEVRYPLTAPPDPSSRLMTEPAPDGQGVRRVFGFHGINGRLDGVVAADPAEEGIRMNVTGLSFDGEVFEEPVQVQDFDGRVVWSGNRGLFRAETVSVLGGTASGSASVELGGGGALNFTVDAVVEGMDLPELQWLEPRLPEARASGRIAMEVGPGGLRAGWVRRDPGDRRWRNRGGRGAEPGRRWGFHPRRRDGGLFRGTRARRGGVHIDRTTRKRDGCQAVSIFPARWIP